MLIARYILAGVLLALGGLLAITNAAALVQLSRKKGASVIPFLGGLFLLVGGLILPNPTVMRWSWLGLFLDFGCVPYTVGAIIHMRMSG